jgi:two-component system, NarL family, sensor histidine kinase UhpB
MQAWAPAGWQKLTAILTGIVVSFFLMLWVDFGLTQITDLRPQRMFVASLPRPHIDALPDATFKPYTLPIWPEGQFGAARIEFEVDAPATSDLALFVTRARDNYNIYLNGQLATETLGVVGTLSTLHGTEPRLVRLLPAMLVEGKNTVDIVVARNVPRAVVYDAYLGPTARLQPVYRHTYMLTRESGLVAAIVAAVVLVFALALASVIRNPGLTLTTGLTLGLTLLNEVVGLWVNYRWSTILEHTALIMIGAPLWASIGAFANEWTGGPHRYGHWFLAAGSVGAALGAATYLVLPMREAIEVGNAVIGTLGAAAIIFMVHRFVRYYYLADASTAVEIAVATIGLVMALALLLTQTTGLIEPLPSQAAYQGRAITKFGTIAIIVFIAVGLARHGIAIYQLATLNNEALARKVDEKEREIAANHALLRDRDRKHALDTERSRIMRDVHDGIGSQLLGLLVQTRAGSAKPETISTGLQAAIDDLYLVIDSLDTVEGSLETALGTFRNRIEPKCRAAGIAVDWSVEHIGETPSIGPAAILQIYRILQEALSNAIRHAGPRRLQLSLHNAADPSAIEISVTDDGKGFDPTMQFAGRGLANMKRRAASIGAMLAIENLGPGSRVLIRLQK